MDGGCTGANGTNPIASLRSRNISFATLHFAQKWYSTTPLRSGFVPLAPVGHASGLVHARRVPIVEPDKPGEERNVETRDIPTQDACKMPPKRATRSFHPGSGGNRPNGPGMGSSWLKSHSPGARHHVG